jgi:hypothetical protein
MVHGRQQLFRWDGNEDGYLDAPLSNHVFIQNAWKHQGANSEAQFGVKASSIDNIGGSTLYGTPTLVPIWSHELQTNRYELWTVTSATVSLPEKNDDCTVTLFFRIIFLIRDIPLKAVSMPIVLG